jgi:hypothetical protein
MGDGRGERFWWECPKEKTTRKTETLMGGGWDKNGSLGD